MRRLEIGPGKRRIAGFETVNVVPGPTTDHVADARKLPFADGTFAIVYASHIIEHVPWYDTADLLREWVRVLAPGGVLEVWTVNFYKVAQALIDIEDHGAGMQEGWHRFNDERDPYKWIAGRTFAFSRSGREPDPNWHRALFTPKSLLQLFERAGLANIRPMDRSEVRGHDHGWCNTGIRGERAC